MLEEQKAELAREREQEHYGEWQAREEAFHREAARQRTNIRLKQGGENIPESVYNSHYAETLDTCRFRLCFVRSRPRAF